MEKVALFFTKSHVDTFTRKDGTVVAAHDDKRIEAKPHPSGKHQPGASVFFPHPDKPGKNALGTYAGHRAGKSVVKWDQGGGKHVDVEHGDIKAARGIPKRADANATSAANHEFKDWAKNVKTD